MQHVLLLLVLLAQGLLSACAPEANDVPATQLIVRVNAEPTVLSALEGLRLRTAISKNDVWALRSERIYERGALNWPVDLVLALNNESEVGRTFEIIIEALDGSGQALVQSRSLTSFVLRKAQVLTVFLARCGGSPLGQLCAGAKDCLGAGCKTCVSGACAPTPLVPGKDLPPFTSSGEGDASAEGMLDGPADGGLRQAHEGGDQVVEAGTPDDERALSDAAVLAEAGPVPSMDSSVAVDAATLTTDANVRIDSAVNGDCGAGANAACPSGAASYCSGTSRYLCVPDADRCLVPGPTSTCTVSSECKEPTCTNGTGCGSRNKAGGTRCSSGVCDGAGNCVACLLDSDCRSGLICDPRSKSCAVPACGDGLVTRPDEPCDPAASGTANDTWHCSPTCKMRTAYILCTSTGTECDVNSSCQSTSQGRSLCMPSSGLGLTGVGHPNIQCPALPAYTQMLWSNAFCVISCSSAQDCPAHLGRCQDSPFVGAGPYEANKYCVPP